MAAAWPDRDREPARASVPSRVAVRRPQDTMKQIFILITSSSIYRVLPALALALLAAVLLVGVVLAQDHRLQSL
jgi:hypothetical protein